MLRVVTQDCFPQPVSSSSSAVDGVLSLETNSASFSTKPGKT